jgi:hypothetical protein
MLTVQPMTQEEKQTISLLVQPSGALDSSTFGQGGSIFDDSGRWIGGAVFLNNNNDTREVIGAVIPEVQGSGLWIHAWEDLTNLLFENGDPFIMVSRDPTTIQMLRKLGCFHEGPYRFPNSRRFVFNKISVDRFLSRFNKIPETQPESIVDPSIAPPLNKFSQEIVNDDGSITIKLSGL